MELRVLQFLSMRPRQPSCGLLAMPQEDLLHGFEHRNCARHPSAGSLEAKLQQIRLAGGHLARQKKIQEEANTLPGRSAIA